MMKGRKPLGYAVVAGVAIALVLTVLVALYSPPKAAAQTYYYVVGGELETPSRVAPDAGGDLARVALIAGVAATALVVGFIVASRLLK